MSGHAHDDISPRAIELAQEINRQCDQLLVIIAATLADLTAHRADTAAHTRSHVQEPAG